jgi:Rieske Fe-S protein
MGMEMGRRDVLKASAVVGGIVVGGAALASCAAAEDVESGVQEANANSSVSVSQIPVGGGYIADEPPVVLTQPVSGDIKAFTAICPHAGCLVNEVVDNEIICPCHGSRFSAMDGSVISGAAATGLNGVAYQVTGDTVTFG